MSFLTHLLPVSFKAGIAAVTTNTLGLNGTSQYLNCGNDASLQITGNLTVSAWARLDNTGSTQYIVAKWNSGISQRGWALLFDSGTGKFRFQVHPYGGAGLATVVDSSLSPSINTWYHVVGEYDGSNIKIYVDGAEQNSVSYSSGIHNSTAFLQISGVNETTLLLLDGSLSNVSLLDSSIGPSGVSELYNGGVPKQPWLYSTSITNNYVLALPLNGAADPGQEFNDYSIYGNSPSLVGSPTINGATLDIQIA